MKLPLKITFALIAGTIALLGLLYFQHFSENYFSKRQLISEQIDAIETAEKSLDYHVLRSGFFLYVNQDEIIAKINAVERIIDTLRKNPNFSNEHPRTLQTLEIYQKAFLHKTDIIYDFQTSNAAIKNATMAIPALKQEAVAVFNTTKPDELRFLKEFSKLSGSVLLTKNSLDAQLIGDLDQGIHAIESYDFKEAKKVQIASSLIGNLKVFRAFFPLYKEAIEHLEHSDTKESLELLRKQFMLEDQTEFYAVTYFSYILVFLYISSLGLIIYFLIQSEIDARTDRLTGLGNRKAYEYRLRRSISSVLFLVNIDKFKHYNDFYGIASGDQILIKTAKRLKLLSRSWHNSFLYRLGGDEFGIVIEYHDHIDLEKLGRSILKEFQGKPMLIEGIETTFSITLAISTHSPLLETADMALKSIKKDRIRDMILYHEGLNLMEVVRENITKTRELRHAVEHDRLIPYFQPIVSLHTGQIEKYEALARLITEEGEIKSIFGYLDVVKESKYYATLTRVMVKKSFQVMKDLPFEFSINLSIDDITDHETILMITQTLDHYPHMASRVVFEILESEAMDDYTQVIDFIRIAKGYGCKIAIDDFGSGYSNFDHLLNLDIDIIKLDGSLIRNLPTSPHAVMIVETIVGFARKAGIKTVAEFASDKETYEMIKTLGIDYAQGYYTGRAASL
ncbi:MAG: EAL domain-containing protein [Sulfuricurvum sp.]|jgi:diguanylate cyclase (GGDEF)-like protein|uniref:EAL domain-containing protein n=1 Tax=Sulfuricurvum sp. TaxID=2025608 RepID=UPI0025E3B86B|nr:EAL domain-containing protein [Sulfuricurvum sp.]MCK9372383.1 EAL domain-containing protein [Sulfuricurvum sp.]